MSDPEIRQSKYILDIDGNPVAEPDIMKWAQWFENADNDRIVARTNLGKCVISTVFLGLDHNFMGGGAPILFETMIFKTAKPFDEEYCERYETRQQALEGHNLAVKKAIEMNFSDA